MGDATLFTQQKGDGALFRTRGEPPIAEKGVRPRLLRPRLLEVALALVLLAVALGVCHDALRRPFCGNDFDGQNLPYRAWYARGLLAGEVSLWCPDAGCGYPLYAEAETGTLYPGNVAFLLWRSSPWWALMATIIAHLWLGGLGVRRHLRLLGCGQGPALLGGLAYLASGPLVARAIHLNFLEGLAWLPWVLVGLESGLQGRRRGWWSVALALGMMGLSGHQHPLLLCTLLAPLYLLGRRPTARQAGAALLAAGVGALLSLNVLLPLIELIGHSSRASGVALAQRLGGSLPLLGLSSALLPTWFGPPLGSGEPQLRQLGLVVPHEWCAYVGALPLLVACASPWLGRRRARWWWLAGALLALGLALGQTLPLYSWLARLPVWNRVRVPGRLVALMAWSLAMLLGVTAHDVETHGTPSGSSRLRLLASVWLAALLLGALAWQLAQAPHAVETPWRLVGCLAGAALLLSVPVKPGRRWWTLLATGLLALDLVTALEGYHPSAPPSYFRAPDEASLVRALAPQRIYAPAYAGPFQACRNLLYPGVSNAAMYAALSSPRLLEVEQLLRSGLERGDAAGRVWLALLRVGWAQLTPTSGEETSRPHLTQLALAPSPEAWLAPRVRRASDSLAAVSDPAWRPGEEAIVEREPGPSALGPGVALRLGRPSRSRLVVEAPRAPGGEVVLGEAAASGWQVWRGRTPTTPDVVDHVLLGCPVGSGGVLRFVYNPLSIRLGLWLTLVACGIMTGWWAVTRDE